MYGRRRDMDTDIKVILTVLSAPVTAAEDIRNSIQCSNATLHQNQLIFFHPNLTTSSSSHVISQIN